MDNCGVLLLNEMTMACYSDTSGDLWKWDMQKPGRAERGGGTDRVTGLGRFNDPSCVTATNSFVVPIMFLKAVFSLSKTNKKEKSRPTNQLLSSKL